MTAPRVTCVGLALLIHLAVCQATSTNNAPQQDDAVYATCQMQPHSPAAEGSPVITGVVLFKQENPNAGLEVIVNLNGFMKDDTLKRGMHIHEFGDLSESCTSTGGHYNPHGVSHPNHPGDMGNFTPRDGDIYATAESRATLFGEQSVMGRAVVLHAGTDDEGLGGTSASLLSGNSGPRLSCCVIGKTTSKHWDVLKEE